MRFDEVARERYYALSCGAVCWTSYPESPWKASGDADLEITMPECCPYLLGVFVPVAVASHYQPNSFGRAEPVAESAFVLFVRDQVSINDSPLEVETLLLLVHPLPLVRRQNSVDAEGIYRNLISRRNVLPIESLKRSESRGAVACIFGADHKPLP